ncbi:MAG: DNA gyrase subunit A [Actinobacteria bacterium RBG_16_68_21]|nr:MAG: DNA gyrase subunit A [Actinobacteria bacterium RBG_16_68_21]
MVDDQSAARVELIDIEQEVKASFLEYAMSVIVSRALPDVRDGLKPVHRRILYSMYDSGSRPSTPFRKSARVVGDVMGWFHPHSGDAIYDAMVRLGQDFATRYPLIEAQGNFGTVDDPPAAMRYTEARLEKLAMHMLDGIDEDTVLFQDNYSGERQEPTVLPARFPNLLVNGSTGIAVGMATNIPPHNLSEVIDATIHLIKNPEATPEQLLEFVKGPDFPTGSYIVGTRGAREALLTGRGSVKMRAVTEVEEVRKGRTAIIVTEIPYQVSRDRIMEKIADLVRDKKVTGIADLRDESDRKGTRLVVELKREAVPQVVLNQLFKNTQLQENFSVNTVALVDGVPRTLNIAQLVGYYVDHQMEVVERRTKFRLAKAEARAHIVAGLLIALDNIDAVVKAIRGSKDTDAAKSALMKQFKLSEIQATHILDMPLRRLTALETGKLREEFEELQKLIKYLAGLLKSPAKRRALIADELAEIKEKFGDSRRSQFIADDGDMTLEDLIADEEIVVTVTANGYVKAVNASAYKKQGRGGRGVKAENLREDDVISHLVHTTAHAFLLFFTNRGKVYRIKAHELPRKERTAKGVLAQSVMPLGPDERIEAVIDTRDYETSRYLVMATKDGQVKKTEFKEYDSRNSTLVAIRLQEEDEVVAVRTTMGRNDLLLFTADGQGIRFKETDLRAMGRDTQGVRGIRLREGDSVVSAASNQDGDEVLLLTTGGYGKRTKLTEFRRQQRGGVGVKAIKLTRVRGKLVAARTVSPNSEIFVTSTDGVVIRSGADTISRQKRDASGVKVMSPAPGAEISAFALVPPEAVEEGE